MTQEEAQQAMMELQQIQGQMQQIQVQKEETESELQGIKKSLKELDKEDSGDVYKNVGNIMIKKDKETLQEELK